jgi:putative oxidoreductase
MDHIDLALLVLRLGVGLTFAVHGAQKVFGWWDGPGIVGWHADIARMGYRPAGFFAAASALAELGGGLLLAAGLLTPLAAAALIAQTVVIVGRVHWRNGFFNAKGGFEFPLLLGVGTLAVALAGPGAISIDGLVGLAVSPATTVLLLAAGLAAGLVALTARLSPRDQAADSR